MRTVMTVKEAASALGISGMTVRRWIENGRLTAVYSPKGVLHVYRADVARIIQAAKETGWPNE